MFRNKTLTLELFLRLSMYDSNFLEKGLLLSYSINSGIKNVVDDFYELLLIGWL